MRVRCGLGYVWVRYGLGVVNRLGVVIRCGDQVRFGLGVC